MLIIYVYIWHGRDKQEDFILGNEVQRKLGSMLQVYLRAEDLCESAKLEGISMALTSVTVKLIQT